MPPFPFCQPASVSALTPREHQVMKCIAQGWANKVIAIELGISQRTAEAHRARVFSKLGVRNAVELVQAVWKARHVAEGGAALAYGAHAGSRLVGRMASRAANEGAVRGAPVAISRKRLGVHYPTRRLGRDLVGVSGGK